jgi:hypothetical protein
LKNCILRVKNSVYAGAFQLLRGRASAKLRGNIGDVQPADRDPHETPVASYAANVSFSI